VEQGRRMWWRTAAREMMEVEYEVGVVVAKGDDEGGDMRACACVIEAVDERVFVVEAFLELIGL
jgi:hypothetical protein